jgi:hypothetical protein
MLMQTTQTFIFKERRLASLIWLWGVLGTLILFFISGLPSSLICYGSF